MEPQDKISSHICDKSPGYMIASLFEHYVLLKVPLFPLSFWRGRSRIYSPVPSIPPRSDPETPEIPILQYLDLITLPWLRPGRGEKNRFFPIRHSTPHGDLKSR